MGDRARHATVSGSQGGLPAADDRAARKIVEYLTGRGESIDITVLSAAEILVKGDVHGLEAWHVVDLARQLSL